MSGNLVCGLGGKDGEGRLMDTAEWQEFVYFCCKAAVKTLKESGLESFEFPYGIAYRLGDEIRVSLNPSVG